MTKIAGSGSGSISLEAWIRGSGSTPKCHGSATLVFRELFEAILFCNPYSCNLEGLLKIIKFYHRKTVKKDITKKYYLFLIWGINSSKNTGKTPNFFPFLFFVVGSGMEKKSGSGNWDKHPGSATLQTKHC